MLDCSGRQKRHACGPVTCSLSAYLLLLLLRCEGGGCLLLLELQQLSRLLSLHCRLLLLLLLG